MRFVLYSDKTVSQCLTALNERLQAPAAANRPALNGWIEKSGRFSIGLKTIVLGTFTRTTHLDGMIERENGSTVIRGSVPDGVAPTGQMIILLAMIAVGLLIMVQGKALLGIIAMIFGTAIYIPLRGDYENSDRLLMEVEKTLKADPKPPKTGAAAAKKPAAPAAKKTQTTPAVKKPAATTVKKPPTSSAAAKKPATATVKKTQTTPAISARKPAPATTRR